MTRPMPLDPSGTARAQIEGALASAPPRSFPAELGEAARRAELEVTDAAVAWEIAALAVGLSERERRALALILLAVLVSESRGSTRTAVSGSADVAELLSTFGASPGDRRVAGELLAVARGPGGDIARRASIATVLGAPGAFVPLVLDRDHLYSQRMHALETRAARLLAARVPSPAPAPDARVEAALADLVARPAMARGREVRLDESQLGAVRAALTRGLTVVTGGPGTGKTAIVVSILRAALRVAGVGVGVGAGAGMGSVALAAPTGKAADRMRASIEEALATIAAPSPEDLALAATRPRARTLHSLLGQSSRSGRFRHHAQNPLGESLVIVDESSMIDLALFERLLAALRPDARLVLLGDADQLPSVDPGAVLGDLTHRLGEHVVRLTESHRMDPATPLGRAILTIARRIHDGDAAGAFEPTSASFGDPAVRIDVRARPNDVRFEGVELVAAKDAARREAFFDRWRREQLLSLPALETLVRRAFRVHAGAFAPDDARDLRVLLDHFTASRLLCVLRDGPRRTGVDGVNEWFHARHAESMRTTAGDAPALMPGEPLLVTRNDPAHGLYNGDTGLVLRVAFGTDRSHRYALVLARDDGFAAHPLDAVRPIVELAYATTVHKAQGSEHDRVALVLPEADARPLGRELVYTAVTRARRGVVLVGARAVLERATGRTATRSTGLLER